MSDAHAPQYRPREHHAKLAVNAAKTLADFIFETYEYQRENGRLGEDTPRKRVGVTRPDATSSGGRKAKAAP